MTKNSITNYINTPIVFQEKLLNYFSQNSEIIIFDIGACEGEDSIKYANLFPNSKIYAFEALPNNIDKINAMITKYGNNRINVIPQALSNKVGVASFFVSSGTPEGYNENTGWDFGNKSSSLLPPDKVKEHFEWLLFNNEIQVETNTIINYCNNNNIKAIDLVHMDVQGAELLVLEGAQDFLNNIKMIWLEVEVVSLYKNQPLKEDIENFMKRHKFRKIFEKIDNLSGDQLYVSSDFYKGNKENSLTEILKDVIKKQLLKIPIIKKILYWKHLAFLYDNAQINAEYRKVSYSQCGEDLIVKYIFDTIGISNPSYIDIGAHHPYYLSNTALFYQNGSRGINIEPDITLYKDFLTDRKEDINLNIGVGIHEEDIDFYIISSPALNTFSKKEAENYSNESRHFIKSVEKVRVRTLPNILKDFSNENFPQFLSIDAEGVDETIIKAIDYEKKFPIVICIETISYSETGNGIKNKEIIDFLEKKGYLLYADTYINSIFILDSLWRKL